MFTHYAHRYVCTYIYIYSIYTVYIQYICICLCVHRSLSHWALLYTYSIAQHIPLNFTMYETEGFANFGADSHVEPGATISWYTQTQDWVKNLGDRHRTKKQWGIRWRSSEEWGLLYLTASTCASARTCGPKTRKRPKLLGYSSLTQQLPMISWNSKLNAGWFISHRFSHEGSSRFSWLSFDFSWKPLKTIRATYGRRLFHPGWQHAESPKQQNLIFSLLPIWGKTNYIHIQNRLIGPQFPTPGPSFGHISDSVLLGNSHFLDSLNFLVALVHFFILCWLLVESNCVPSCSDMFHFIAISHPPSRWKIWGWDSLAHSRCLGCCSYGPYKWAWNGMKLLCN